MISTIHNQKGPCKAGLIKSREIIEKSYTNGRVQCSIYVCVNECMPNLIQFLLYALVIRT